jgi:hypothetical protein
LPLMAKQLLPSGEGVNVLEESGMPCTCGAPTPCMEELTIHGRARHARAMQRGGRAVALQWHIPWLVAGGHADDERRAADVVHPRREAEHLAHASAAQAAFLYEAGVRWRLVYRGDPHRGILRDLHSYNVVHHTVHRFARCAAPPLTGKLALILSVFLSTSRSTIRSANLQSAVSIEEVYVHRYATRRGDDGARGYPKVTPQLSVANGGADAAAWGT